MYTYRDGKRVPLVKRPDQFVVRTSPHAAADAGLPVLEKVSPHSARVAAAAPDLESAMEGARAIAPTHHAYDVAETGTEFLITDRVIVTFKTAPSDTELAEFTIRQAHR